MGQCPLVMFSYVHQWSNEFGNISDIRQLNDTLSKMLAEHTGEMKL